MCTGEHWITVLDGATSQWKRSEAGSAAIGAGRLVARRDARERVEVAADRRHVGVGRERAHARLVEHDAGGEEAARAAEEDDAGVDALAALDARDDAHQRVLERARRRATARLLGLGGEAARLLEPAAQVLGVLPALARRVPLVGHEPR